MTQFLSLSYGAFTQKTTDKNRGKIHSKIDFFALYLKKTGFFLYLASDLVGIFLYRENATMSAT